MIILSEYWHVVIMKWPVSVLKISSPSGERRKIKARKSFWAMQTQTIKSILFCHKVSHNTNIHFDIES